MKKPQVTSGAEGRVPPARDGLFVGAAGFRGARGSIGGECRRFGGHQANVRFPLARDRLLERLVLSR